MNVLEAFVMTLGWDTKDLKKGESEAGESMKDLERRSEQSHKEMQDHARQTGETYERLAEQVAVVAAAFLGGREVKEFAEQMLEAERAGGELAEVLGVDVKELQAWQGAVEQEGGSVEGTTASLRELNKEIAVVGSGSPMAQRAMRRFALFGLHEADVKGKTVFEVLEKLSGKLQNMSLGQGIGLGEQFGIDEGMVRVLRQAGDEREALLDKMRQTAAYSNEDAEAAKDVERSWALAKRQFTQVGASLLTELTPAIKQGVEWLQKLGDWMKEHPAAVQAAVLGIAAALGVLAVAAGAAALATIEVSLPLLAIAAVVGLLAAGFVYLKKEWDAWASGAGSHLAPLFQIIKEIGQAVAPLVKAFEEGFSTVGKIVKEYLLDDLDLLMDELKLVWALLKGDPAAVREAMKSLGEDWTKMGNLIRNAILFAMGFAAAFTQRVWSMAWNYVKDQALESIHEIGKGIKEQFGLAGQLATALGSPSLGLIQMAAGGAPAFAAAGAPSSSVTTSSSRSLHVNELHVHTQAANGQEVAHELQGLAGPRGLVDQADGGF